MAVAADGRRVVSGGEDRTLRLWDLEAGHCVGALRAGAPVVAVACGDGLAVAGDSRGGVHLLRLENLPSRPAVRARNGVLHKAAHTLGVRSRTGVFGGMAMTFSYLRGGAFPRLALERRTPSVYRPNGLPEPQ